MHTQMPVVEWLAGACHRSDEETAESCVIRLDLLHEELIG